MAALIRNFERKEMERVSLHDEIEATYSVFERDGRVLLQIDSYGRADREMPGKKSQTIQLDRDGARALFNIIKREFSFDEER
ncbi:methionyl-tRNA formyltransferase [Methylobacterium sp. CM6241]